jgi:hypothetical protein
MPSSVLSHQAPALLIKLKYPHKIDGTAICMSTFLPDLNIFLDFLVPGFFRYLSHSLLGLFLWTLPLTLIFTILFSHHIAPYLSKVANKEHILYAPLRYFGIDKWHYLKQKKINKQFYYVASYSALIGGLTHLLLDLPAHQTIELFFPFIFKAPDFMFTPLAYHGSFTIGSRTVHMVLTVYNLIWFLETVLFIFPTLYALRYIAKKDLIEKWYQSSLYPRQKIRQ